MILGTLVRPFAKQSKLAYYNAKWRKINSHNSTRMGCMFPIERVKVGNFTYGVLNLLFYGEPDERILIGHFCSIAGQVSILAGGEHNYRRPSTFPFTRRILDSRRDEAVSKGPVIISDDVWIGHGSTILSGVHIGQGAVIGAGSVVSRDVPPYAIYAGGRVVKYRFTTRVIDRMLELDFSTLDLHDIGSGIAELERDLNESFFMSPVYTDHLRQRP